MILEKINTPEDLKQCSIDELDILSLEMREAIIKKVNTVGGHFGPNLGIVEATIAMHYVFDSPTAGRQRPINRRTAYRDIQSIKEMFDIFEYKK